MLYHHHHRQNAPFRSTSCLRRFSQTCLFHHELDYPVFTSFDFATIIFCTQQGHQPCSQPPSWRIRSLYLCPPVTGLVIHPCARFPFCCLVCLAGLQWMYSNPPPHGKSVLSHTVFRNSKKLSAASSTYNRWDGGPSHHNPQCLSLVPPYGVSGLISPRFIIFRTG